MIGQTHAAVTDLGWLHELSDLTAFLLPPPGTADHHRPVDRRGRFPLMVEAFEGNAAETTTMLPTIRAFMAAHQLTDVTIVADAWMVLETNRRAIEACGCRQPVMLCDLQILV